MHYWLVQKGSGVPLICIIGWFGKGRVWLYISLLYLTAKHSHILAISLLYTSSNELGSVEGTTLMLRILKERNKSTEQKVIITESLIIEEIVFPESIISITNTICSYCCTCFLY